MALFTLSAQVVRQPKFHDVKDRPYQKVGFMATVYLQAYEYGDDARGGRNAWLYVEGTPEVAAFVQEHGLRLNERVILHVVEPTAFGGGTDDKGRQKDPMPKFVVSRIELPGRPTASDLTAVKDGAIDPQRAREVATVQGRNLKKKTAA
ncbi:hypothetical protein [Actinomadura kijaniata]|uniref:hypothetical protein n=1 Tax=Actinomadura kijaniata TaxID=46161 RepID=UPI00082C9980|nr:hypothetical protein [Actinomadura kijaniata]